MGSLKDRNGMDLTEAENIKKTWQEYTELYQKDLYDPDNHHGVITHLEWDILECEVKWALGSITLHITSGGDGIPVELFKITSNTQNKISSTTPDTKLPCKPLKSWASDKEPPLMSPKYSLTMTMCLENIKIIVLLPLALFTSVTRRNAILPDHTLA